MRVAQLPAGDVQTGDQVRYLGYFCNVLERYRLSATVRLVLLTPVGRMSRDYAADERLDIITH